LFEKAIRIHIPAYDMSREVDRKEIPALVLMARTKFSRIRVRFYDMGVDFPSDAQALVIVTAGLEGQLAGGEPVDEIHELECLLDKREDGWYFRKFEAVEVLEK